MKIFTNLVLLSVGMLTWTSYPALAQGTLQFQFSPTGGSEIPANGSSMIAVGDEATLSPSGLFAASVGISTPDYTRVTAINIVSAMNPGEDLFQFTPGGIVQPGDDGRPGSRQFNLQASLNQTEAADLKSGLWYVNVTTSSFPNGEIRGQILPVPEPSTMALLTGGLITAAVITRRRFRPV